MSIWNTYPPTYREKEVNQLLSAIRSGECAAIVGLSGSGKSNLIGFLAHQVQWDGRFVLVDCNRLSNPEPDAFYRLIHRSLGNYIESDHPFEVLQTAIAESVQASPQGVCLLLDRFDALVDGYTPIIANNLRALRDAHKYQLTFVTATRRPLDPTTELSELVFANTVWLGILSESDVLWNVERYASRKGLDWGAPIASAMHPLTWGYPSLLRAVSEAHALGCKLELEALQQHPSVLRRIEEFWMDQPTTEMLRLSGLEGHPLLKSPVTTGDPFDTTLFTAKENLLFKYLRSHPNQVCEKDTLIQAVWPEDMIYEQGIRDDSLAQLVRRLRKKIEPDPSAPSYIHTIPGRGYLFKPS